MTVGIISDTHDDMEAIKKAVDIFNNRGVSHVIHAGDFISPFTFEVFGDLKCPLIGIFGNNDGDKYLLNEKSQGSIYPQPHIFTLYGKNVIVIHEHLLADALAESNRFDIVIYGHSHEPDVRKVKDTLVINPGKAARLHKGTSTLVLLDVEAMEAEIIGL